MPDAPSELSFNPLTPDFRENPYPFFEEQRRLAPIHWSPLFMGWVFLDHDSINQVLQSPDCSSERTDPLFSRLDEDTLAEMGPIKKIMKEWALMVDPPYHTTLRGILNQAFAPKVVRGFEARIEGVVAELLAEIEGAASFDFVEKFAYPLPAIVIADILGLPRSRTKWFEQLSKDLIGVFNLGSQPKPEFAHAAQNALFELNECFNEILDTPGEHPEGSMIQILSQLENGHQSLTRSEVLSMISMLLVAGHETTRNLLSNGLLCLMQRPDLYQEVRDNPELLPGAIEEMLRFESPVQLTSRHTLADITIAGVTIEKGQRTMLFMGAANRDPKVFEKADVFDIRRSPNKHVAFGFGRHFCVGAMLARMEAKVAFAQLLKRFPLLQIESKPVWYTDVAFRCLSELRVKQGSF